LPFPLGVQIWNLIELQHHVGEEELVPAHLLFNALIALPLPLEGVVIDRELILLPEIANCFFEEGEHVLRLGVVHVFAGVLDERIREDWLDIVGAVYHLYHKLASQKVFLDHDGFFSEEDLVVDLAEVLEHLVEGHVAVNSEKLEEEVALRYVLRSYQLRLINIFCSPAV